MQSFIGCKIIQAKPMTNLQYRELKNKPGADDISDKQEGYLVVYPDGYESWSPKAVFEQCYREISEQEIGLIGESDQVAVYGGGE